MSLLLRSSKWIKINKIFSRSYYGKLIPDHSLRFVQVFHRHGDRTPLNNYYSGTDKQEEERQLWSSFLPRREEMDRIYGVYQSECTKPNVPCDPVFGQLTVQGIEQMQAVGNQIKRLYFNEAPLLNESSFNTREVSLRSTCRDRTLHSIQCLLSALFPIKEFNASYPIIKVNSDDTCCLNKFDDPCKEAVQKRLSMWDWTAYMEKMAKECLPIITKELPYFVNPKTLKWTEVMDFIVTRYKHFIDIPEEIYNLLPTIYMHNVNKFQIIYNTPKCVKLLTADLLSVIQREAESVENGMNSTKLSIYSCHDTTILSLLNVLCPYLPPHVPIYAANIMIEYWENEFDHSYSVALRYNGDYQPVIVEHYQESIVIPYADFCKTLSFPKYLLDVMHGKNKVAVINEEEDM